MYNRGYTAGQTAKQTGKRKDEVPIARNPDWVRGFHDGYDGRSPSMALEDIVGVEEELANVRKNRDAQAQEVERLRQLLYWCAAKTNEGPVLKKIAIALEFTQADWDLVRSLAGDDSPAHAQRLA